MKPQGGVDARVIAAAGLLAFLTGTVAPTVLSAEELTPEQIIRRADQTVFPDAYLMRAGLETTQPGRAAASMEMTVTYKRDVGSRIELLSPPRSRGIRFLQKEDALWLFNPKAGTNQAIRLSPKAAFQGSVFSNRDIGDPQYSKEYDMRLAGSETFDHPALGKVSSLVLEGTARNEQVAYSKVKLWVRSDDYMLLQAEYYAKSGLLFKKALFTGVREMGGRERPTVIRIASFDQPDRESVLTVSRLEERPDLPDSLFTLAALTR
jgi:outer membrane lipoprotein-sorting protein